MPACTIHCWTDAQWYGQAGTMPGMPDLLACHSSFCTNPLFANPWGLSLPASSSPRTPPYFAGQTDPLVHSCATLSLGAASHVSGDLVQAVSTWMTTSGVTALMTMCCTASTSESRTPLVQSAARVPAQALTPSPWTVWDLDWTVYLQEWTVTMTLVMWACMSHGTRSGIQCR